MEKIKSDCRVEIMRPGLGGGEEGGPEGSGGASLCHISIMMKWRKEKGVLMHKSIPVKRTITQEDSNPDMKESIIIKKIIYIIKGTALFCPPINLPLF